MRLTGNGIDFNALRAGNEVEFELDAENGQHDWADESESDKIDYEKLFRYRNMDMIAGSTRDDGEGDEDESDPACYKTPFEMLKLKMYDVSDQKDQGVLKKIIMPGVGIVVPNGARVRSNSPFDSSALLCISKNSIEY